MPDEDHPCANPCHGMITNYNKKYSRKIGITDFIEAFNQSIVLKKML